MGRPVPLGISRMPLDVTGPELRLLIFAVPLVAVWVAVLARLVVRAQRAAPPTGREGMVGLHGVAQDSLSPRGWVLVRGETWQATAESPVADGERVLVVSIDGLALRVRKEA